MKVRDSVMDLKPLPIGTDDFGKLIRTGYYYVDKTLLIKELLDKKGEVNLFTRPRRFGKSLNMSMLQYFFEDTGDDKTNTANKNLFQGLDIWEAGEKYTCEMSNFPVISLSLKSAKQATWELSYLMIKRQIMQEFERHEYIQKNLTEYDQDRYKQILQGKDDIGLFLDSLSFLSKCLQKYFKQPVIILIDEYDVPLENAYFHGFYSEMITFIRALFESALKSNPYLYFSVITGCLRITKESIFTGLNNLEIHSILSKNYSSYFGFTVSEVNKILSDYHLFDKSDEIRQWYDGYLFGNIEIYNPWSIMNHIKALLADIDELPRAYWSNTSSNNIIRSLIERADMSTRAEIEELICGNMIEKPIHEDITYEDIYTSMDNLWNFLFFTGYLKNNDQRFWNDQIYTKLSIPNIEILQIYKTKIRSWFQDELGQKDLSALYKDILDGNVENFEYRLTQLLQNTISFYDNVEAFYHGFLIGILGHLDHYIIKSNRESGDGRYDIMIRSLDVKKPIIMIELKFAHTFKELSDKAKDALQQIKDQKYDLEFAEDGYQASIRYGISFYKKSCAVLMEKTIFP